MNIIINSIVWIITYSITFGLIRVFDSIQEAHRITKFNNISACCRKVRNKAGGYKWQYA